MCVLTYEHPENLHGAGTRGRLEGRKGFINGDRVEGRINSSLAEKVKLEQRWGDFKGRWGV